MSNVSLLELRRVGDGIGGSTARDLGQVRIFGRWRAIARLGYPSLALGRYSPYRPLCGALRVRLTSLLRVPSRKFPQIAIMRFAGPWQSAAHFSMRRKVSVSVTLYVIWFYAARLTLSVDRATLCAVRLLTTALRLPLAASRFKCAALRLSSSAARSTLYALRLMSAASRCMGYVCCGMSPATRSPRYA